MAQTTGAVADLAGRLIGSLSEANSYNGRFGKVTRYLNGDHDLPYMPRGASNEYKTIAEHAITNWLPLVSSTYSQGLFVEGFRADKTADNAEPWRYWQENGLDARQSIVTRGALEYGVSYGLVLPGASAETPHMRPLRATRTMAWYEDDDDEYPEVGIFLKGRTAKGETIYQVFDALNVYTVLMDEEGLGEAKPRVVGPIDAHGLGVTPLVRFRPRLDCDSRGIIAPLFTLQDRVNEVTFALSIALQFASFKQRWATGLAIPVDPGTGKASEPFKAAVDRLWVSNSPDTSFGEFAQTEVQGHLGTYESTVKSLSGLAQIPTPTALAGDLANLSAEAMAQLRDSTQRQITEYETILGESYEQWLRLGAKAAGNSAAAADVSAQVRWRDSEARSLTQTVDALGTIAEKLQVPPEVLWEMIPGISDQDVERWKAAAESVDGMALLTAALDRQSTPVEPAESGADSGTDIAG